MKFTMIDSFCDEYDGARVYCEVSSCETYKFNAM